MRTFHEVKIALQKAENVEITKITDDVVVFEAGWKEFVYGKTFAMMNHKSVGQETFISRIQFSKPYQKAPGKKTNVGNPNYKGKKK